jgi:hypothetical protein
MASAVRMAAKAKMVSQPRRVISELLPSEQRVEEVDTDHCRGDQAEQVSAAHIASIPKISATSNANIASAIKTATTSMRPAWRARRQEVIQTLRGFIQEL